MLVGDGEGGDDRPRDAWPVLVILGCRAVAQSRNQVVRRPTSMISRVWRAPPSISNQRDRKPRRRSGSSTMRMPDATPTWPALSFRKDVLPALAAPLTAGAPWPNNEYASRRPQPFAQAPLSSL